MNSILLLAIGALSPWTVHLAPPRQRPYALVGVAVVIVLYGVFAANPLAGWELWAGLAAGVLSVLFIAASPGRGGRRHPPSRRGRDAGSDDPGATGEIR